MAHHADAMRAKRRGLAVLVAVLVAAVFWLARGEASRPVLALSWLGLFAAIFAGNRLLRCPACGRMMGGLFEKLCSRCGALLTDEPVMPPSVNGPVDPRAAGYMEESRRILQRWSALRKKLGGKTVILVGFVAGAAAFAFGWLQGPDHHGDAVVLGLVCGPVLSAAYWLILVYGADNLFGVYFLLTRGRCPLCRAWINPPSTMGPESIHMDLSLPNFCPSCSAKLS